MYRPLFAPRECVHLAVRLCWLPLRRKPDAGPRPGPRRCADARRSRCGGEIERQRDDVVSCEAGARHIVRDAIDAERAVEGAAVREEDLQQRHAAAVRRLAVTNARRGSVPARDTRRRAGPVVLCAVSQHPQLRRRCVHGRVQRGKCFAKAVGFDRIRRQRRFERGRFAGSGAAMSISKIADRSQSCSTRFAATVPPRWRPALAVATSSC